MKPTRLQLLIHQLAPIGPLVTTNLTQIGAKRASALANWSAADAARREGKTSNLSLPGLSGNLAGQMPAEAECAEWEEVIGYLDALAASGDGTVTPEGQPGRMLQAVSLHRREVAF